MTAFAVAAQDGDLAALESVLTVRDGEPDTLVAFEIGSEGISRLLFVRNPHKLERLRMLIVPE